MSSKAKVIAFFNFFPFLEKNSNNFDFGIFKKAIINDTPDGTTAYLGPPSNQYQKFLQQKWP